MPLLAWGRRHWRKTMAIVLLGTVAMACGMIFWAGTQIASPSRRPLQDYHREYLSAPTAHGLVIERFTASDGTPCLVCSPNAEGTPGDRGRKIREQLTARELDLPEFGKIRGTLVLCHGRRGRKEDYLPIAERLCAAGFRCILPDLPAHGDHPETIATYGVREAGLPARILREAATKFGFDRQPAGLIGMSMGGSVAVHAADLPDAPWRALVVISSFDSFSATISDQASRYIGPTLGPTWASGTDGVYRWKTGISLNDIQPTRHAAHITIPTLIAHGSADRVVSMAAGRRLFDALPATTVKRWEEIPTADHDNVLITHHPIYADIVEWMIRHVVDP